MERSHRCVISLGVGKAIYRDSLLRLEESLRRVRFDGDYLYWDEQLPKGSPEHFDVPFGFKSYCFYEALNLGYREVLWIDSACVAIRSLHPVFQLIKENGYVMFNNNYDQMMGQWSSDAALAAHGLTRDEAMAIPEHPCSVIGLDLSSPLGRQFLEGWHQVMGDGITVRGTKDAITSWEDYQAIAWNRDGCISSDPRVRGHRHDQLAAGLVASRLGMTPYCDALRDVHYKENPINRHTSILHHREFGNQITPLDQIYFEVFFRGPFWNTPRQYASRVLRALKRRLAFSSAPSPLP